MVKVKFCGLSRIEDINNANELKPEYIGFVFWDKSKRYVNREQAAALRKLLHPDITAVGVFLDETVDNVAKILNSDIIDIAQLHGHEDDKYIKKLRELSNKPVIKAFNVSDGSDIKKANECPSDFVLLDSKTAGSGNTFDWNFVSGIERPYFLAGGLNTGNIKEALKIDPYAVDVSSGIETDGIKDEAKMRKFIRIVRSNNI